MKSKPVQLYSPADVKKTRELLLEQQEGFDPITGEEIPKGQAVLDHDHKTQYVRAVLHRQSNAVLGKIENLWTRYLGWWYSGTLSDFLRGCANYLDKEHPKDYLHPSALKRLQIDFNKLTESQKRFVLRSLGQPEGSNGVERKKLFQNVLKSKQHGFVELQDLINKEST